MLNTWLPFACLVIVHFALAVPGALFGAAYWDDENAPDDKAHRKIYWFVQIMIGLYVAIWLLGLVFGLISISGGKEAADLFEGVVDTVLFLFMLCIAFASHKERLYRKGEKQ